MPTGRPSSRPTNSWTSGSDANEGEINAPRHVRRHSAFDEDAEELIETRLRDGYDSHSSRGRGRRGSRMEHHSRVHRGLALEPAGRWDLTELGHELLRYERLRTRAAAAHPLQRRARALRARRRVTDDAVARASIEAATECEDAADSRAPPAGECSASFETTRDEVSSAAATSSDSLFNSPHLRARARAGIEPATSRSGRRAPHPQRRAPREIHQREARSRDDRDPAARPLRSRE